MMIGPDASLEPQMGYGGNARSTQSRPTRATYKGPPWACVARQGRFRPRPRCENLGRGRTRTDTCKYSKP
eukprot:8708416-Pyramimonas_sp.AAC.1